MAAEFLIEQRAAILAAAADGLRSRQVRHYDAAGEEEVRLRLERLYDGVVEAVGTRDLSHLLVYARRVADERFTSGYDLGEVQTAFNVLEEAIWSRVFAELPPAVSGDLLAAATTAVGAAKDALARHYVELATETRAPALDVDALAAGPREG
jgi:hypothetical protein